jgi:uncharacterized 2Fe-2S/4Fe-4S cluster protein (DUF4445 family)
MYYITIHFQGESKQICFEQPILLSAALQQAGVPVSMPCGGRGVCGKCKVKAEGDLSEPSEKEKLVLGDEIEKGFRLACMTYAQGDTAIFAEETESVILSHGKISSFEMEPKEEGMGFAVDIGTTTVAVYGCDLETGTILCQKSFPNPQRVFGGDVISRIEKALSGMAEELRRCLVEKLEDAFLSLCEERHCQPAQITRLVLTGNTTMMYLLLGETTEPLSHSPFIVTEKYGRLIQKEELSFPKFPSLSIWVPPLISAFVGSDITSAVLASGMTREQKTTLLIDVGTNGEMALWDGNTLFCCSTAAGPAFEGAGISMGMPASPGAISQVDLKAGEICCQVIGDVPAVGICGSGLIDAIALLKETGIIDESGAIDEENEPYSQYITEKDEEPAVRLGNTSVLITQRDIRQIQLAKSAICAGILTLLHQAEKTPEDVSKLLLAGGFGSFIRCEKAGLMGLIPNALWEKAEAIGNAAGMGAVMELLSAPCRKESLANVEKADLQELSTSPFFMEQYVECMLF